MSCFSANVNSPNTDQITVLYGVDTPSGALNGTIVMLPGAGGQTLPASFADYIPGYLSANYQVIEAEWGPASGGQPWEYTDTASGENLFSILAAACRPATFLNWVRNGNQGSPLGSGIWAGSGGMCAHGDSGGAGALGYALAWYNAGAETAAWGAGYLDKVVMENGPVFSDMKQGCEVQGGINSQYQYICANGSSEPGCGSTWPQGGSATDYHLEYVDGDQSSVEEWTQSSTSLSAPACGSTLPDATTSGSENAWWYNTSIVNFPSTGQQPSFSYPNTPISGWLCQSVSNTPPVPNNSAPQGQIFFNQFQSPTQALSVNAVTSCPSSENIEGGIVYYDGTYYGPPPTYANPSYKAIIADMTTATGTGACTARH
jgi:hypothetical protein